VAYVDPKVVCAPWITADQLCCEGGGDLVDCDGTTTPLQYKWTDDQLILAASNLLYARTCYRYPGVCTREVWPCLQCSCASCGPCGCGIYRAIELTSDDPILSIVSVEINGVVVPNTSYRLDEHARVVRTDGERWPSCNNLGLTADPVGHDEIRIEYTTGRPIPIELQMACAELVCELKKACNGDPSCKLPAHVRSVTRRGVEMEVYDAVALLSQGLTGNPIIDHALTVYGRCGQARMSDITRNQRHVRTG
jgi:hypothetical protein